MPVNLLNNPCLVSFFSSLLSINLAPLTCLLFLIALPVIVINIALMITTAMPPPIPLNTPPNIILFISSNTIYTGLTLLGFKKSFGKNLKLVLNILDGAYIASSL